jgi:uncharacterized repeat protein (TIGR04076 family)
LRGGLKRARGNNSIGSCGELVIEEATRNYLRSLGFKNSDFAKLSPPMIKLLSKIREIMDYKVVVKVIESSFCVRNLKAGDKYILIGADLSLKETTAPFCIYAMPGIARARLVITERIVEGLDPNGLLFNTVVCEDPGLDYGGLGNVKMKVYCEKAG